eukprot:761311-Hanusia_phi.AAC.6
MMIPPSRLSLRMLMMREGEAMSLRFPAVRNADVCLSAIFKMYFCERRQNLLHLRSKTDALQSVSILP